MQRTEKNYRPLSSSTGALSLLDVVLIDLGGTLKEQSLGGGHFVEDHALDAGLSAPIVGARERERVCDESSCFCIEFNLQPPKDEKKRKKGLFCSHESLSVIYLLSPMSISRGRDSRSSSARSSP